MVHKTTALSCTTEGIDSIFQVRDIIDYTGEVYSVDSNLCNTTDNIEEIIYNVEPVQLYRVILQNGIFIIADADQKLMLIDGTFKELKNIVPYVDSLFCTQNTDNLVITNQVYGLTTSYSIYTVNDNNLYANNCVIYSG